MKEIKKYRDMSLITKFQNRYLDSLTWASALNQLVYFSRNLRTIISLSTLRANFNWNVFYHVKSAPPAEVYIDIFYFGLTFAKVTISRHGFLPPELFVYKKAILAVLARKPSLPVFYHFFCRKQYANFYL